MIGITLIGVGPAPTPPRNLIDSSENIYNTNPINPDPHAPAPTSATSYYPEAPGFVRDPRLLDINRDFGMQDFVPQWDTPEQAMLGLTANDLTGGNYTDPATVKAVQQAILDLPQYKTDAALDLGKAGADGKLGPDTRRAVAQFNMVYRNAMADADRITDGTLAALMIAPPQSSASPNTPVATRPGRTDKSGGTEKSSAGRYVLAGGLILLGVGGILYALGGKS